MKKSLPLLLLVAVAIGVAVYFSMFTNSKGTSVEAQTDFVISDTASVGKIFIATAQGGQVTLSRKANGTWDVNGKNEARPDAINTLLATFKNIYIQRPVSKDAVEQASKVMAGAGKKVEIYDLDGNWIKTWFVGHATMDKKGTFMLLETPKWGRSAAPYIMDMKGFIGMLNTRFFTNENEWRKVIIWRYDDLTIRDLKVEYPGSPEESFRIEYEGGNDISLFAHNSDQPISNFDTSLVKDYLLNYKLASFENYKTGLTPEQSDSVMSTVPYQVITIRDDNTEHKVTLWAKSKVREEEVLDDESGEETEDTIVDGERVYAATQEGELALAQRFVWDKFRAPLEVFIKK